MMPRMDFYNELWGPAYLLVRGRSPYDTSSLNPVLPAAWLPMAIGLFFPLGWLSENAALQVWFIFNIIELCVIVYMAQENDRSLYNTVLTALLCFFFPLTLNHFNLGQISITITLCIIFAGYFLGNEQQWPVAFFIALACSKPHLASLVVLGISCRYYAHGGIKALVSFLGTVIFFVLVLCAPLFIAYPNWIPDAIKSMTHNPFWYYPSLFVLFPRYIGAWGYLAWGLVVLLVVALGFNLWTKFPQRDAMYWSLALAPLVSPYIGSWDFVVLFPLLILTFVKAGWNQKIFLIIIYGIAWYGMTLVQMEEVSHNHFFWWVPIWFIGALALVTDWKTGGEHVTQGMNS